MVKVIKRLAQIRGKGIKVRCRKEDYIFVEAQGSTDEEALANLLVEIDKTIKTMRSYEFRDKVEIYNIECDEWSTARVVFPQYDSSTEYKVYSFSDLISAGALSGVR